jgi:hypothetical protein
MVGRVVASCEWRVVYHANAPVERHEALCAADLVLGLSDGWERGILDVARVGHWGIDVPAERVEAVVVSI